MTLCEKDNPLPAAADSQMVEDAIWTNMFDHYLAFGNVPGSTSCDTPEVKWVHVEKPLLFNRIFGARFTAEDAVQRVATITELVASWGCRVTWLIDPGSTPQNLIAILEQHGWKSPQSEGAPYVTWPGMALALSQLADAIPVPEGLTITQVADDEALRAWMTGFFSQASPQLFDEYYSVYRGLGVGDGLPWSYYTAYLHGEPVASSLLHCAKGVAGVYWIGTIPAMRRQGIGMAMTWHALQQAKQRGYHWAILQATAPGVPVYRRLGFAEYGAVTCLSYQP